MKDSQINTVSDPQKHENQATFDNDKDNGEDRDYVMLPNGQKRYVRATAIDVFISILLSAIGLVIGLYALFIRKERKRGITMIGISLVCFILFRVIANSMR